MLGIVTAIIAVLFSGYFFLVAIIALLAFYVSSAGKNAAIMKESELTKLSWTEISQHDVEIISTNIELVKLKRRLVTCVPERCVFLTPNGVESIDRSYIAIMRTKTKKQSSL